MPPTARLLAAVAAGLLAAPATALAADPPQRPVGPIPVPDGQVQHTVRTMLGEANYTVPGQVPFRLRIETWVGNDRGRMVQTDVDSGALVSECVETATRHSCYSAEDDTIRWYAKDDADVAWDSWAREAKLIRQQVEMGWFQVVGDTEFQGRPAKQLELTPGAPGESDSHSIVAEPETLYPLRRVIFSEERGRTFRQTDEVQLREVLAEDEVDLSMRPHPGARVVQNGEPRPAGKKAGRSKAARSKAAKRKAAKRRAAKRKAAKRRGAGRRAPAARR